MPRAVPTNCPAATKTWSQYLAVAVAGLLPSSTIRAFGGKPFGQLAQFVPGGSVANVKQGGYRQSFVRAASGLTKIVQSRRPGFNKLLKFVPAKIQPPPDAQKSVRRLAKRYVTTSMKTFAFFMACVPLLAWAQDTRIVVDDCGPLARGELGVVFSLAPHGSGKGYFAKGKATEVCPKLLEAKYVVGYEEDYCKNYTPRDPKECIAEKVFVIKEYVFE